MHCLTNSSIIINHYDFIYVWLKTLSSLYCQEPAHFTSSSRRIYGFDGAVEERQRSPLDIQIVYQHHVRGFFAAIACCHVIHAREICVWKPAKTVRYHVSMQALQRLWSHSVDCGIWLNLNSFTQRLSTRVIYRLTVQTLPDGLETQFTSLDTVFVVSGGRCELGISFWNNSCRYASDDPTSPKF